MKLKIYEREHIQMLLVFWSLCSGFLGFEIIYSDLEENITVTFSSLSGELLLSPMPMQFLHPRWNEFSISKDIGMDKKITLVGCVEVINFALQSIQYFGCN